MRASFACVDRRPRAPPHATERCAACASRAIRRRHHCTSSMASALPRRRPNRPEGRLYSRARISRVVPSSGVMENRVSKSPRTTSRERYARRGPQWGTGVASMPAIITRRPAVRASPFRQTLTTTFSPVQTARCVAHVDVPVDCDDGAARHQNPSERPVLKNSRERSAGPAHSVPRPRSHTIVGVS
jgi:hypothetical protein